MVNWRWRPSRVSAIAVLLLVTGFVTVWQIRRDNPLAEFNTGIQNASQEIGRGIADTERKRVAVTRIKAAGDVDSTLAEILTQKLTVSLVQQSARTGLQVIERSSLDEVLREQANQLNESMDPSASIRLGHLVGAEVMVTGTVLVRDGRVELFLKAVDVETGKMVSAVQVELPVLASPRSETLHAPPRVPGQNAQKDRSLSDHAMTFFIQNWPWLWMVILVPLAGWFAQVVRRRVARSSCE